ncbi:U-box domain-containing protein [Cordyceps fumosorosea ARSEF 2679]|uniref:U-box domain-containing protein n=1 Tax=Cordyceps fumosorosea (strain ARSEF 2679) TaxID=1081104 RepID=A0A162JNK2_CORFA|nr:U-box domain-containing protein [Cordyceps fumosorosea ARSEF 2679]OAA71512.1 U-box domain-containing protein [Cordyceps fumosorosea ARSEF 2679]
MDRTTADRNEATTNGNRQEEASTTASLLSSSSSFSPYCPTSFPSRVSTPSCPSTGGDPPSALPSGDRSFPSTSGVSPCAPPSAGACCLAHGAPVTLASGEARPIQDLHSGDTVQTLAGPRLVVGLLRTFVHSNVLCRLGGSEDGDVMVSAWHPVSLDGAAWCFPVHLTFTPVLYTGNVYSMLLVADGSPLAHTFLVAGALWCASLGHGVLPPPLRLRPPHRGAEEPVCFLPPNRGAEEGEGEDVRSHPFFGDYVLVCEKMAVLRPVDGAYQCYGVTRDPRTGLVNGFKPVPPAPTMA